MHVGSSQPFVTAFPVLLSLASVSTCTHVHISPQTNTHTIKNKFEKILRDREEQEKRKRSITSARIYSMKVQTGKGRNGKNRTGFNIHTSEKPRQHNSIYFFLFVMFLRQELTMYP